MNEDDNNNNDLLQRGAPHVLPLHPDPQTSFSIAPEMNRLAPSCWRLHWKICTHTKSSLLIHYYCLGEINKDPFGRQNHQVLGSILGSKLNTLSKWGCRVKYMWTPTFLPDLLDNEGWASSSCTEEREQSASSPLSHWLALDVAHPAPTHTHTHSQQKYVCFSLSTCRVCWSAFPLKRLIRALGLNAEEIRPHNKSVYTVFMRTDWTEIKVK